jgi:hypothetical protein
VAILSAAALVAPGAALADTPPQITFNGSGGALQGGWLRGAHTVAVRAQDDIGVARVEFWIDSVLRAWRERGHRGHTPARRRFPGGEPALNRTSVDYGGIEPRIAH